MTEGVRFPTLAFITGGTGQAKEGIPPQPFETFCYDSALKEAKIHDFNVVPYTSVLPPELFGNIVPYILKNVDHRFFRFRPISEELQRTPVHLRFIALVKSEHRLAVSFYCLFG